MHSPEKNKPQIQVTKAFLPPFEDYVERLRGIWERGWLTNHGPLLKELEDKLRSYLGVEAPIHCLTNGGLGLQLAIKALGVTGEVITTPFSYVATTACPLWEGCSVKFADIDAETLTIDPDAVGAAITPRTEAILATHVFGNPCDVSALEGIAKRRGLALVFDAAHAFGVRFDDRSILEFGDISMVSMHATKLFHTIEGGFVFSPDPVFSAKLEWMRRFGHRGLDEFHGVGINAKMSEFQAAMGLCNLEHIENILVSRRNMVAAYHEHLAKTPTVRFAFHLRETTDWNCAYFPVLFKSESSLLEALERLSAHQIIPRRYFYPSLNSVFPGSVAEQCPVSVDLASRICCLPLFASEDFGFMQDLFSELY